MRSSPSAVCRKADIEEQRGPVVTCCLLRNSMACFLAELSERLEASGVILTLDRPSTSVSVRPEAGYKEHRFLRPCILLAWALPFGRGHSWADLPGWACWLPPVWSFLQSRCPAPWISWSL